MNRWDELLQQITRAPGIQSVQLQGGYLQIQWENKTGDVSIFFLRHGDDRGLFDLLKEVLT